MEHTACTMDDPPEGKPWCKVGENATHLIYDNCNMDTCERRYLKTQLGFIDMITVECGSKLGEPCIFPFTWQGLRIGQSLLTMSKF